MIIILLHLLLFSSVVLCSVRELRNEHAAVVERTSLKQLSNEYTLFLKEIFRTSMRRFFS